MDAALQNVVQNVFGSDYQLFDISILNLVQTGWVTSNVADILFINTTPTGGGNILVNQYPLIPGGYISFNANTAEVNKAQFNVIFLSGAVSCFVIKKMYTKQ